MRAEIEIPAPLPGPDLPQKTAGAVRRPFTARSPEQGRIPRAAGDLSEILARLPERQAPPAVPFLGLLEPRTTPA
jgi:hypothetical protein